MALLMMTFIELTSLLFSYPANDVDNLSLTLPLNCTRLINANTTHCDCGNHLDNNLDILTQQVSSSSVFTYNSLCTYSIELANLLISKNTFK